MMEVDQGIKDLDKPSNMEVDEELNSENKVISEISDTVLISEIKKEPEDKDKNEQPEEQDKSKQPEEQDKSKQPEEQDKNTQQDVPDENMQPKEQDKNKLPEKQDKNKEPEEQDKNKQPEEQDKNKQPEEQDKNTEPEIKIEPEENDKKEQPEISNIEDDSSKKKDEGSSRSRGSAEPDLKEIIRSRLSNLQLSKIRVSENRNQKASPSMVTTVHVSQCHPQFANINPSANNIRLSAGASIKDDGEEIIHLTAEEAKQYLLKKIGEYMNSPVNPLFTLRAKAKEAEEKGKNQVEEYCKLYKGLQLLQRKHENFLRNVDILPKITMCHVNVSADLPMESVPHPEALLKKELSITKVENPPTKLITTASTQAKTATAPAAKPSNIECIDLTDEIEPSPAVTTTKSAGYSAMSMLKHPAPLPPRPFTTNVKKVPPKPRLKISAEDRGIVLQWDMPPNPKNNPVFDPIATFEIFGYQEQKNSVINTSLWKKIGSVKSMSLPMACTLTQFVDGNKYHFAIRAVDVNGLCGHYSDAISIVYKQRTSVKV